MTESERYKLSTYQSIKELHQTETAHVELVECSLDGKKYVRKTYNYDKRTIFYALSKISSPFLPHIYEVFFGEDTIVIEEYVDGVTLEQLINSSYIFSKKEVQRLFENLLSGLAALHENGIVHRDIKPSNIIIKPDGQAVLIDFSIARPYSESRSADTELLGTIGYAAPEQYGFSQSDFRTDIYALGATLKAITFKKDVPKHIIKAIERCAAFDPANRFQTINEIQHYLASRKRIKPILLSSLVAAFAIVIVLGVAHTFQKAEDETFSPLLYEASYTRIVDIDNSLLIPCLQVWEDGYYKSKVSLHESLDDTVIEVACTNDKLKITVDGISYDFENDYTPDAYSYPDGELLSEIIFYDLNNDGYLDIIPVICNAVAVQYPNDSDVSLLKNYSLAWCIYYDGSSFNLAEGCMIAYMEPFRIYAAAPGCLWTDFPSYYKLENNAITLNQ